MKVKKIRTKKQKRIIMFDLTFVIICILKTVIATIFAQTNSFQRDSLEVVITIAKQIDFGTIIVLLLLAIILLVKNSLWLLAIYIPFRISRIKVIRKNKRYEVIENIEYFREVFKNISPAEISLIADLEIEDKKDISATILKLNSMGVIEFKDDKIFINENINTANLKKSEKALTILLEDGKLNLRDIAEWRKISIEEAIQDGYIEKKEKTEKRKRFWGSTIVLLGLVFLLITSIRNLSIIISSGALEQKENVYEETISEYMKDENNTAEEKILYLKEHPNESKKYADLINNYKEEIINILLICVSFVLIPIVIIYKFIRSATYKHIENGNGYKRTSTGKILSEQIGGMQKYIHDFSLLSEREKEEVKLWNDFLVYAIILEENEKIIDDIFKYKNIEKRIKFF